MRVVVGLGNPGARYARTRHNIGFLVAADLAAGSGWVDRWSAQTATLRIAGETVLIVRPQTYMNRSGDAVLALSELEGFALEETLVVFDDFLLDFGRIRLRRSGSDGGHNGLSSIIEGLRTDAVPRLHLGVGQLFASSQTADSEFGLRRFLSRPHGRIISGLNAVVKPATDLAATGSQGIDVLDWTAVCR